MIVHVILLSLIVSAKALENNGPVIKNNLQEWINQTHIRTLIMNELRNASNPYEIYLRMFDASTKIPSGFIFGGSFFDLGNFDECYNIHSENVYGKYCLGRIPLQSIPMTQSMRSRSSLSVHPQPRLIGLGNEYVGYYWSICVPSTIPADQIIGVPKFYDTLCYSKDTEPSLSTGAILTIVTLSIFGAISIVSTIYDVFLFYLHRKPRHEMLIAFSYLSNGRKLIKSDKNPDHLLCLNGIRAISMMWVMLGHLYSCATNAPLSNFLDVVDWGNDVANMVINGGTVSVDTFFAVGGLVTVYTFLNAMEKGQKFNIILYYLHRFLRLTPALGVAMLVYYNLVPYLGNGPLWTVAVAMLSETCRKSWWNTLLYFANYVQDGYCVPQTWYLQVDMQLFLLSPLVLIPLVKWKKWAYVELGVLAAAGILVPFCLGMFKDVKAPGTRAEDVFIYYTSTYARFGPYVIGLIAGVLIYKLKKSGKANLRPWIVWSSWIESLLILTACVYAGYLFSSFQRSPAADEPWGNSFFLGFNRNAWSAAVCAVIYLCVAGYGGPIDYFLSIPIFQFISKLSYCIFIVHYAVINIGYASSRNLIRFSNGGMFFEFWGYFMTTLLFSALLSLTFESPVIIIEKWLFGKKRTPDRRKIDENDSQNKNGNNA